MIVLLAASAEPKLHSLVPRPSDRSAVGATAYVITDSAGRHPASSRKRYPSPKLRSSGPLPLKSDLSASYQVYGAWNETWSRSVIP